MYSFIKNARLFFLLYLIYFSFITCDSDSYDDGDLESNNIVEYINSANYDSLAVALEMTGLNSMLTGETEYTLFAPSNDAFERFLLNNNFNSLNGIPEALLRDLLMNHIIKGTLRSSQFSTGYLRTISTAGPDGENLSMYMNIGDGFLINGRIKVNIINKEVRNGIVHGVRDVIDLPSISTFLEELPEEENDPQFDGFNAAAFFAYYIFTFSEKEEPLTVFAPTNEAFESFYTEQGYSSPNEIDPVFLRKVLNSHLVSGENLISEDFDEGRILINLNDEDLTINLNNETTVTDLNERIGIVIIKDIQAVNGVIHAIDKVLMPGDQ